MRLQFTAKMLLAAGLLLASLVFVGCQSGGGTEVTAPTDPTQGATTGGITTKQVPTVTSQGTPTGPANADISPSEVTAGNFVLTMAVEPAQHMFDYAQAADTSTDPAKDKDQNKNGDQLNGIAVLGGMMLKTTNNIDAAQNAKEDSAQGEIFRHVSVQVKDKSTGQLVPYLTLSMDALRDGRQAFSDQALVPELPVQSDVSQMRYGNNVKFPRAGTYQLFIRSEASPLLGSDLPPAAQFNLTFK